jgi:hypothetical protein
MKTASVQASIEMVHFVIGTLERLPELGISRRLLGPTETIVSSKTNLILPLIFWGDRCLFWTSEFDWHGRHFPSAKKMDTSLTNRHGI